MPTFEEAVTALVVRALAIAFVLLIAAAIAFRRQLAGIRSDWTAIDFHVDEPVALAILTLFAVLLRMAQMERPMGADESATALYYASKPLLVGISVYGSPNNHLLHTALVHLSSAMFGNAEWALRLPAFVAGVALVPLVYLCRGGLQAAAAAAAWPALIDYSTDARGYTLLCCFVLICTFAAARVRDSNRAACALFILSAALGFFTIPVMVYPFVMLLVWCGWRRETVLCAAGTIALTLLLYLPALTVTGITPIISNGYVQPLPIATFFSELPQYARSVGAAMFVSVPMMLSILIAAALVLGLIRRGGRPLRSHTRGGLKPASTYSSDTAPAEDAVKAECGGGLQPASIWVGLLFVILLLCIQRVLPFPRVWLPFVPLLFIAAAYPLPRRADRIVAAGIAIALATSVLSPHLRETGELRAVREIVRELRIRARPGDPVIALPPSEMPLTFYAQRAGLSLQTTFPDVRKPRIFAIENRDYGQHLPAVLAWFHIDARAVKVRRVRDFGSSVLYELRPTRP